MRQKPAQEPAYVLDVFGPCPDCVDGRCEMNCGQGSVNWRELVASAVIQLEARGGASHKAAIMAMLKRINPSLEWAVRHHLDRRSAEAQTK